MADQLSNDLASLRIEKVTAPREGRFRWLVWTIVLGVVLAAAGAGYVAGAPYLEAQFFKAEIGTTEVLSISPATVSTELTASGYVVPQVISKVGSKVQGRIAKVHAAEGQVVKRGDLLIHLEDADQRSAIAAAQARVASAEAEVQRQRVQLAETQRKLTREKALSAAGVTGRSTAEDLEAQLDTQGESIKAAEANVVAAKADVHSLQVSLEHTTIRAPIGGTILTKPPELGEVVSPDGQALFEIADFGSLVVEADVPEPRLAKVRIGGPCEIMLEAYPNKRYRGTVKEISPLVNKAKATVLVKVAFVGEAKEPRTHVDAGDVLPNMAARAFFLDSEESAEQIGQPPKTIVPSSAVVERAGAKMVFVVDGDVVKMTPVELGPPLGSGFELIKGPRVGTRLVSNPAGTLVDGQRIKERKPE